MDIERINRHIQERMLIEDRTSVTAVEAAIWLDEAGLLHDSITRKGKPIRGLLRSGLINNCWQDSKNRWFIDREQ